MKERSRKDRSLVAFTLLAQMAVGAFWLLVVLHRWATGQVGLAGAHALTDKALLAIPLVMALAVMASFFHLGTPLYAWRALANLRSSWLSREILFAVLFTGASALLAGLHWFELGTPDTRYLLAWSTGLLGLLLIYSMAHAYRLRTVPAWDTWITPASFFLTAFLLGGLAVGSALVVDPDIPSALWVPILKGIAIGVILLLSAQLVILSLWIARLAAGPGAAAHAALQITRTHRALFRLRLALALLGVVCVATTLSPWGGIISLAPIMAFGLILASEVLGRLLFYVARVRYGV